MGNYNFEDDNKGLGETVRLESLNDRIKNMEVRYGSSMADTMPGKRIEHKNVPEQKPSPEKKYNKFKKGFTADNPKAYMIFAVIGGLAIFTLVFLVSFLAGHKNIDASIDNTPPPVVNGDKTQEVVASEGEQIFDRMIVKNIGSDNEIEFYDTNVGTNMSMSYNSDTKVSVEGGKVRNVADLHKGDLIKVISDGEAKVIKEIKSPGGTWIVEDISDVEIDGDEKELKINGENYEFTDETVFRYDGKFIEPASVIKTDTVTVSGTEKEVLLVEVKKYHGFITVKNTEKIDNGYISIDNGERISLIGTSKVPAESGKRNIKITGDNISEFKSEVYITDGEETSVDLGENIQNTFTVNVKTNVDNFNIYVDGNRVDTSKPIVISRGTHTVKVEKDGYVTQEHKISDNGEKTVELNLIMEEVTKKSLYTVVTSPDGADVLIDGVNIGKTPTCKEIEYGSHRLVIKKQGYEEISLMIDVKRESEIAEFELTEID